MSSPLTGDVSAGKKIIIEAPSDGNISFPDANALFGGEFARDGFHLQITGADGQQYLIKDYFIDLTSGDFVAPNGAILSAVHAAMLAGPRIPGYAQAAQQAGASKPPVPGIGQVESVTGTATATRADGTKYPLSKGTVVHQGDIIETSASTKLSLVFADRTIMNLDANSRMVLDQFTYTAQDASSNSMLFTALQGAFVFLTGFIAPSGDMKINTPVATMGIRGTTVVLNVAVGNGETKAITLEQPDGKTGTIEFYALNAGANAQPLATSSTSTEALFVGDASGGVTVVQRPPSEIQNDVIVARSVATQRAAVDAKGGPDLGQKSDTSTGNDSKSGGDGAPPGKDGGTGDAKPKAQDNGKTGNKAAPEGEANNEGEAKENTEEKGEKTSKAPPEDGGKKQVAENAPEPAPEPPANNTAGDGGGSLASLSGDGSGTGLSGGDGNVVPASIDANNAVDAGLPSLVENQADGNDAVTEVEPTNDPVTTPPPVETTPTPTALTISLPTITPTVTEDGSVGISGFVVSGDGTLSASITALSTVAFGTIAGLAFTVAKNHGVSVTPATGVEFDLVSLSGSATNIEDALNSITYFPTTDDDGDGTLNITISNGSASSTASLTVNINPVQDQPSADAFAAFGDEDATSFTVNLLTAASASDPDTGDVLSVTGVPTTDLTTAAGRILSPTTHYTFSGSTFELTAAGLTQFNDLADGTTDSFDVVYQITDSVTAAIHNTATIFVIGANDGPIVSAVTNPAAVPEGDTGILSNVSFDLTNYFTASDVDTGETPAIDTGSIVITANASSDTTNVSPFVILPANPTTVVVDTANYNFLAAGESAIVDVTFDVVSGVDRVGTTVQITVTGANDAPVVSAVANPAAVPEGDTGILSNVSFDLTNYFTASDVDTGETPAIDTGSIVITANASSDTTNVSPFVILPANPTTVVVDTANYNFLAAGESAIVDVTFDVVSGVDRVGTTVQITVTGANDVPTIVSAATVINETLTFEGTKLGESYTEGAFTVSLQDLINSPVFSIINIGGDSDQEVQLNSSAVNEGYVLARSDGGTFDFNGVTVEQNNGSAVTFRDAAGNQSSHGAGTLTFPTAFNDTTSMTIYGNAVLDDILVAYRPSINTGAVTELVDGVAGENTQNLTATGSVAFNDIDVNDSHTVNFTAQGNNYLGTFVAIVGDAATGDGSGRIDWTFTVNDSVLESLPDGQVLAQLYDVSINDGTSGPITETVTIAITGENDAPTVSTLENLTANFNALPNNVLLPSPYLGFNWTNANGWLSYSGHLESRQNQSQQPALTIDRGGEYFQFDGINIRAEANAYTATLRGFRDGVEVATQSISLTPSYTLAAFSVDVSVDTVQIADYRNGAIFGPNAGAPKSDYIRMFVDNFTYGLLSQVGSGAAPETGVVTELPDGDLGENTADLVTTGSIVFTDSDVSDSHTVNFTPQTGGYIGSFNAVIGDPSSGDGFGRIDWTFTLNDALVDSLASGDALTQSYDVTIDDGTNAPVTRTVEVTVNGTNDAPTLAVSSVSGAAFGGTINDHTIISSVNNVPTADYTVSFWASENTATSHYYISYAVPSSFNELFISTSAAGEVTIHPNSAGATAFGLGINVPQDGEYHHIAVVMGVTPENNQVVATGYVDGVAAVSSVTIGTVTGLDALALNGTLVFGQEQDSLGGGFIPSSTLQGNLADVAFFDGKLSAGEISLLAAGQIDPQAPNLAMLFRWDDSINNFVDQTGNNSGNIVTSGNVTTAVGPSAIQISFDENNVNTQEQPIISYALVTDAEGNFDGGSLVVSGLNPLDYVNVENQGTGAGEIGYSSGSITYEGTLIGVVGVGANQTGNGENLEITFNGSATSAAVGTLVESLTYGHGNMADTPTNTSTLTLTLSDAAGGITTQDIFFSVIPEAEDSATIGGATAGNDTLLGTAGADVISALAGDDILIGNGDADELLGGSGNDILAVSTANFELLRGGNDQDTLRLDGDLDLDLTGISNLTVRDIETIDLQTAGSSTLTLDIFDVFDISGTANTNFNSEMLLQHPGLTAGTSYSNTENLVISGGSTDSANLVAGPSGSWQDTGNDVTLNTEAHSVYNYVDGASILATIAVDNDINTT